LLIVKGCCWSGEATFAGRRGTVVSAPISVVGADEQVHQTRNAHPSPDRELIARGVEGSLNFKRLRLWRGADGR
jgi:hypothetical protein